MGVGWIDRFMPWRGGGSHGLGLGLVGRIGVIDRPQEGRKGRPPVRPIQGRQKSRRPDPGHAPGAAHAAAARPTLLVIQYRTHPVTARTRDAMMAATRMVVLGLGVEVGRWKVSVCMCLGWRGGEGAVSFSRLPMTPRRQSCALI